MHLPAHWPAFLGLPLVKQSQRVKSMGWKAVRVTGTGKATGMVLSRTCGARLQAAMRIQPHLDGGHRQMGGLSAVATMLLLLAQLQVQQGMSVTLRDPTTGLPGSAHLQQPAQERTLMSFSSQQRGWPQLHLGEDGTQ
jgi:hypothetical protein